LAQTPYDLPSNWTWTSLENVCWLDNGKEYYSEKLPYLEARYLRGKKEAVMQDDGIILNVGDKIILVDGENSGEVFDINERGYMGSTFRILKQSPAINAEFLQLFLDLHRKMFRDNKTGSAIPHLNKKIFASLPIAIPPLNEQRRIVSAVGSIVEQINLIE
jgi:type I restriction enzyme S subunit